MKMAVCMVLSFLLLSGYADAHASLRGQTRMAEDLARQLNMDWNAASGAAIPGVAMHFEDGTSFDHDCDRQCSDAKPEPPETNYGERPTWADCSFSAGLYRLSSVPNCSIASRDQVWTWQTFGWVLNFSALRQHVRCSYMADGSIRPRYNHGCGCDHGQTQLCAGGNCSNACQNIDSRSGLAMTPASMEVSSCHCKSIDQYYHGISHKGCYWRGPVDGADELQQMLIQQERYPAPCDEFNPPEIVADLRSLHQALQEDFASIVLALVVVDGTHLEGVKMSSLARVQQAMQKFPGASTYDLSRTPVLGIKKSRESRELPFFALK